MTDVVLEGCTRPDNWAKLLVLLLCVGFAKELLTVMAQLLRNCCDALQSDGSLWGRTVSRTSTRALPRGW